MKNKRVKQMLFDVVLKGRKAIWYGEESEIFAANSVEQCHEEFKLLDNDECEGGVISSNWRYWWTPCVCEKAYKNGKYITRGGPVLNKQGELIKYYESLPLISAVYGNSETVAQISTRDN